MTIGIDRPMLIRGPEAGSFLRINRMFGEATGLCATDLAAKPFVEWIEPGDRPVVEGLLGSQTPRTVRARHRVRDGGSVPLEISVSPSPEGTRILARCLADEDVFGVYGVEFDEGTVTGTLETIARIVEDQNPGYRCSILLKDADRFARGAGPSLPEAYNAAIDGEAIGPSVGSCGTAIYWNVPVVVEDIQADPLWSALAPLAAEAGVAACWSHPFTDSSGEVLGALALYAPEPAAPTATQLEGLRAAARMTGLAVERGRVEEALREKQKREAELEEQLRQAAKMEAIGVLAGGVAHDFNNLLTTISGNAELALARLPEGHPARDMLDRIVVTSQRAGEFCSQMLTYAGRGVIARRRVELSRILYELSDLAHAALSKKAVLEYSLHSDPIFVEADENQLLQVMLSLITNAAEAIGDEQGRVEVSTQLCEYDAESLLRLAPDLQLPAGRYVRVTVRDTGQGIDSETLTRIFDPFFTTKFAGRGLGLASVTGIVRKHNGAITVDSEVGVGTTFELLLPTVEAPSDASPVVDRDAGGKGAARQILVVDDEDGPRRVFRLMLEDSGFDVVEAVDGEDALRVFGNDPHGIDCVLLDLSMPRLRGDEVLREMRRVREDIPVVLISGFSEQEILDRLNGASNVRTLQKPVTTDVLVAAVGGLIPR